jgi:hypothetical protein
MARNLDCRCLCHGSDGNRIGDDYFSCKGCYAANHMNSLPRHSPQHRTKPAAKGPRKPRIPKPTPTDAAFNKFAKDAAKTIMNDIANAAQEIKDAR